MGYPKIMEPTSHGLTQDNGDNQSQAVLRQWTQPATGQWSQLAMG